MLAGMSSEHSRAEIHNDCDVEHQREPPRSRAVSYELDDLERQERDGDEQREVFRPAPSQKEADAFDREQRGVREASHRQLAETSAIQGKEACRRLVDQ